MKRVKLKESQPMSFKDVFTFYSAGSEFEVLEEKEMPMMGKGYKLRCIQWNIILEGIHNAKSFKVIGEIDG